MVEFKDKIPLGLCCPSFEKLRADVCFTDVQIYLRGDEVINAHKVILAGRIPNFKGQILGPIMCMNKSGTSASAVKAIVAYAYTGKIEIHEDTVRQILVVARQLGVTVVVDWCCQFMTERLHPDRLLENWEFAHHEGITQLRLACLDMMKTEFTEFILSPSFPALPFKDFLSLLESDDLRAVDEEQVVEAILNWTSIDGQPARLERLHTLLAAVRWGQTEREFRSQLAEQSVLNSHKKCRTLLSRVELWISWPRSRPGRPAPFKERPRQYAEEELLLFGPTYGLAEDEWSACIYSPQAGETVATRRMKARPDSLIVAAENGLVYMLGGRVDKRWTNTVREYNVRTRRCRPVAPMLEHRRCAGACAVGGEIVACGGKSATLDFLASCEFYDPKGNTWQLLPPMLEARYRPAVAALPDKRLFVIGGYSSYTGPMTSVEFCTFPSGDGRTELSLENMPASKDFWRNAAPVLNAYTGRAVCVFNGKIILGGGYNGQDGFVNDVEIFMPPDSSNPQGQWTRLANMRHNRYLFHMVACSRSIFAVGDLGNAIENGQTVESLGQPLNPQQDRDGAESRGWTEQKPLAKMRYLCGATAISRGIMKGRGLLN
ncbi:Kelch-like protein 5 [Sparganum proliferum]